MEDAYENLNIDFNVKRLLLIALNRYRTLAEAASALGIKLRTLHNYKDRYNIVWEERKWKEKLV